ncbi:MAG: tail fiber domain-containing protein [Oscillospiraceae bacterium]|nr:tail fiber domain-containing protein [Oscillospiraceae bacterium]
MPADFLAIDTNFPMFTAQTTTEDKVTSLHNYVYLLVEQLRYSLFNLDTRNFSPTALRAITEPIYARISDSEGNISSLAVTAQGLESRVGNAEGGISQLTQTANGLQSTVSGIDGRVSTVQQTINGLTVTDWYGRTYINGAMIQTGTVTANYLIGEVVGLRTGTGYDAGQIMITGADTASFATDLTSYGALRLQADNGAVHISSTYRNTFGEPLSTGYLQLSYMSSLERMAISCGADTVPNSEQRYLGASRLRWAALYAVTGTIQTSDRRKKHAIEYDEIERYEALFDSLKPVRYKYNDGTSDRYHTGFIAQDVEESLKEAGLSTTDFAGFVKSPAEDGYDYGLRYEEFIALNTREIQKLKARVSALEGN